MSDLMKKLYEVTEEDVKAVRKYYERVETDVRRDCWLIEAWMKKQAHFPNDYDEGRIERILLRNKFRLEQTKTKLENYYTVKGFNIAILKDMDPADVKMQTFLEAIQIAPIPKLMNNLERVYVSRLTKNDEHFSMLLNILFYFAVCELELSHDYAVGIRMVCDCENLSSAHVKAMGNVNTIAKLTYMYQECLSGRILGMHFVNAGSIISVILDILKLAFPEKLYKKISVHKDINSLKAVIPEEYLPCDYEGGQQRSFDEMSADVKQLLLENRDFIMKRVTMIADESKRIGEVKKNEMFGIDGTFKNINID